MNERLEKKLRAENPHARAILLALEVNCKLVLELLENPDEKISVFWKRAEELSRHPYIGRELEEGQSDGPASIYKVFIDVGQIE